MKIKCWFCDCEKKSPEMSFLDWLLVGLVMFDWRFWLCKEHREVDFEEVREELCCFGKMK